MDKEYRNYTEKPTIMLLLGLMSLSTLAAVIMVSYKLPEALDWFLHIAIIIIASISFAVYLVAFVYPALCETFCKKRKKDNNDEL